jgi:hypothetical protein
MGRFLVLLAGWLVGSLPVLAQTQSFDVFRFQAPRGWKVIAGQDEYGLERAEKNQFCQIALYRALPSTGSAAGDFEKEWDTVKKRFTVLEASPRESGRAEGWAVTNGAASVEGPGTGRFITSVQVYSGFGVRASVVLNMNHMGCKGEFEAFLGSVRLEPGQARQEPVQPRQESGAAAPSGVGGWVSSAEANPQLGAWPAELRPDCVQFTKGGMTVRVYYGITITDAMRSRGDMRQNVWNLLVAPEYRTNEIRFWDNSPGATGPYSSGGNFLTANAVEAASGARVTVGMNYAAENGIVRVLVAIARDEATFARMAGTPELMERLSRLNMFLVPAKELNGRWTSSFNSAAEMYNAVSGSYTGLMVASASLDIAFDNGRYQSRSKATGGRLGALQSSSDSEAGSYQLNGSRLTLMPEGKERTEYLVWFQAVRGGMMLHLLNDKFRGIRWDLLRAR